MRIFFVPIVIIILESDGSTCMSIRVLGIKKGVARLSDQVFHGESFVMIPMSRENA